MNTFAEQFNEKYKEKIERTRLDYEKKNRKLGAYTLKVREMFDLVETTVANTPISLEKEDVFVKKRKDIDSSTEEALHKLTLKIDELFITFTPLGIDYQTGAARLRVEHNNEREKPMSIDLFLRTAESEGAEEPEFIWQVKIGYRNFREFNRELIEGLIETIFLS